MSTAFITLWRRPEAEVQRRRAAGEDRLSHAAGGQFRRAGVAAGDRVFVVGTRAGALLLIGRLDVAAVVDQAEAARRLGSRTIEAPDHLLGEGTALDADRVVPEAVARQIERASGRRLPIADDAYRVHPSALRTTGPITDASAALLDGLIDAERPAVASSGA